MAGVSARTGFAVVAASHVAYVFPQPEPLWTALNVAWAGAFIMAAADARRGRMLFAGLAIAAVVGGLALVDDLGGGFTLWTIPQAVYATGILMMAFAARTAGHDFGVKAGAVTAAFGTALWVILDPFNAVSVWLIGNVLGIAGMWIVAFSFSSSPAPAAATDAPA